MNDTIRGPALASTPFFDQEKGITLLDSLPVMDEGARVANDQVLMILVSACILQERFGLESGTLAKSRSSALAS